MKRKLSKRLKGRIVHVGESRSAPFWAIIRSDDDGELIFSYGKSYLSSATPRPGRRVSFVALPAIPGTKYRRGTEVEIQRPSKSQAGRVVLSCAGDLMKILLIEKGQKIHLGMLDLRASGL